MVDLIRTVLAMDLILGGINGKYLRSLIDNEKGKTEKVVAAVAYATDTSLLFDWCDQRKLPVEFYGRLDEDVAVSAPVLRYFLSKKSGLHSCNLVQHHHAKVIWWKGYGLYIGSANLTQKAWYKNVEAGCFFREDCGEITQPMANDIDLMFATLRTHATPLTEELLTVMQRRANILTALRSDASVFNSTPSFVQWPGLVTTAPKAARDRQRSLFLKEWYETLQQLRDIGSILQLRENTPKWVIQDAPLGALVDQFLHAHYYQRTFTDGHASYENHYAFNKDHKQAALQDAIKWWKQLVEAPGGEDTMLNKKAPSLRKALMQDALSRLDLHAFIQICQNVHAVKDYARRVPNASVGLPSTRRYTVSEKVNALATRIWKSKSGNGKSVKEQLAYVIYGGDDDLLPERIWDAVSTANWKIEGLGVSAVGEIAGWARPDRFPPRNGRTSKALRSLGYDVRVHVS